MHENDQPLVPVIHAPKEMTQEEWNNLLRLVAVAKDEGIALISYKSCRIRFHTAAKTNGPTRVSSWSNPSGSR